MEQPKIQVESFEQEQSREAFDPARLATRAELATPEAIAKYMEVTGDFLILTKENVEAIGEYLVSRMAAYRAQGIIDPVIVEVGAGNGRLSHFLNKKFATQNAGMHITPTDDASWSEVSHGESVHEHFPVERYESQDAMKHFKPTIVLCSMMTPDTDLSIFFRENPNVQEYILLGHKGGTGDEWKTHGESYSVDHATNQAILVSMGEDTRPPYVADGFERIEISEVSAHLISDHLLRRDTSGNVNTALPQEAMTVRCYAFRRIKHNN
jgi:hypothetical protein